ncbi:MAG: hypothetical protein DI586_06540 [Micavibrio aeruginosavorus]|uniref:EF-hand domain-containing protein n=1 Tax=Micavibrio aeruginosavorus TaxID=349221 RepID=A0A2W5FKK6_9BACT|nr:MAG: hypothetical protein DI586_06540 [Micavibrio aeruginosavorus]
MTNSHNRPAQIPVDWDNIASSFQSAIPEDWDKPVSPAPPPVQNVQRPGSARGLDGSAEEVSNWRNSDLTLRDASQSHVDLWFGQGSTAHPHDMIHVIYGMAIDGLSGGHHYQGDGRAEAFVTAIQGALYSPEAAVTDPAHLATEQGFIDQVKERARMFEDGENLGNTLSWIMGKKTGQTIEAQRIASGFEPNNVIEAAKKMGIQVTREWPSPDWKVETPEGKIYSYNAANPELSIFPNGSNGVENFERFAIPSDNEIRDVFNRVKPVIDDLQPQIREAEARTGAGVSDNDAKILENLRARDIAERMNGVAAPLDIHARREAQPRVGAQPEMVPQPSQQQQFMHQPSQAQIEVQERQRRFQEARAEWERPAQSDFASRYAEEFNRLASGEFLRDIPSLAVEAPTAGRLKTAFTAAAEHGSKGAVMGMSAYGIATKLGGIDENFSADNKAGGERAAYAKASVLADMGGFGADAIESGAHVLTNRAAQVAANLENPSTINAVGKMAGILESGGGKLLVAGAKRAAMPLALAAGGFEVAAAIKARDPERAAGAVGGTFGGLVAGAGMGALGGSVAGPPGAVVGGIVGGVAGAIVGEKVAKEVGTNAMAGIMGEKPPEGKETTSYKVGRTLRDGVKPSVDFVKKHPIVLATGPLLPVVAGVGAALESKTGKTVIRETRQAFDNVVAGGVDMFRSARNGIAGFFTGKEDPRKDPPDRLAGAAAEMSKNQSWVRHADRNGDGKVSSAEIRRSMAGHGQRESGADKNHDGRISTKEVTQFLNEGIAAERREIAIDRRGLDRMSADQLRKAIHDDNILPDTVKIGGKQMDITTALKNPEYLDKVADRFEAMHVRGDHDYSKQVAMLRELQERQSGHTTPTQVGPSLAAQLGR